MKPDIYTLLELALLSDDPDEKGRMTDEAFAAVQNMDGAEAVSYTHLTLPTKA